MYKVPRNPIDIYAANPSWMRDQHSKKDTFNKITTMTRLPSVFSPQMPSLSWAQSHSVYSANVGVEVL